MVAPGRLPKNPGFTFSFLGRSFLLTKLSGWWGLVVGIVVIVGWYAHWAAVIQVLPNLPPMKFNTALCFILCGVGLILLTTRRAWAAPWLGGVAALVGLLTLAEYVTGRSFGIDQFFVNSFIDTATKFPGRMSQLAAGCFTLMGLALALTGRGHYSKNRLTAIGILVCIVAMIAFVALLGYSLGIEVASGWGAVTRMAVHTSLTFFVLSGGLLIWARRSADQTDDGRDHFRSEFCPVKKGELLA